MINMERPGQDRRVKWWMAAKKALQGRSDIAISTIIEPHIELDPVYDESSSAAALNLPINHLPSRPGVILDVPFIYLLELSKYLDSDMVDIVQVRISSPEDFKDILDFDLPFSSLQILLDTTKLIPDINPSNTAIPHEVIIDENSVQPGANVSYRILEDHETTPSSTIANLITRTLDLVAKDIHPSSRKLLWEVEIGVKYAIEIAKIRALHLIVDQVWQSPHFDLFGFEKPEIRACCLAKIDPSSPEESLIELSVKCMAASVGSVHNIILRPDWQKDAALDLTYGYVMVPKILEHESAIYEVKDPFSGSYWIETATRKIAEEAWEKIRKVKGGF